MEKADIIEVGKIVIYLGRKIPQDFSFGMKDNVKISEVVDGTWYFAGYTIEELERIIDGNNILKNL